jgi:hypothetical protein
MSFTFRFQLYIPFVYWEEKDAVAGVFTGGMVSPPDREAVRFRATVADTRPASRRRAANDCIMHAGVEII